MLIWGWVNSYQFPSDPNGGRTYTARPFFVAAEFCREWSTDFNFFSWMRSKGSRFTLGVWGLRVCSLDVAFTVATVRNRSQPFVWGPYGRAYGKFCRGGPFWRFQTSRCFVSRGRRGTSWHSDVFCNVSKVVLCGRRNTCATFSEDVLHFSWQAQHFRLATCPSSFFLAGAAL